MSYHYFYKVKTLMCLGDELTDKDETVLLEIGFECNDCVAGNSVIWRKKGSLQKSTKHLESLKKLQAYFYDSLTRSLI